MTLVEFLTARLDEDAELLKALPADRRVYMDNDGCISEPIDTWADGDDRLPNHHNNWYLIHDPARALREVEAKRAILRMHRTLSRPIERLASWTDEQYQQYREQHSFRDGQTHEFACHTCDAYDDRDYGPDWGYTAKVGCPTLRLLAAVYSDHPDYDEARRA